MSLQGSLNRRKINIDSHKPENRGWYLLSLDEIREQFWWHRCVAFGHDDNSKITSRVRSGKWSIRGDIVQRGLSVYVRCTFGIHLFVLKFIGKTPAVPRLGTRFVLNLYCFWTMPLFRVILFWLALDEKEEEKTWLHCWI